MGIFGYATGGASGFGPSEMYKSLPYKSWKEISTWLEESVDAIGNELDIIYQRAISPAARADLLNPSSTSVAVPDAYRATGTAPPLTALVRDTMLDVLSYVSLGIFPLDSNLTTAQKQAIAALAPAAIRRKGNRIYMLALAAAISDGVVLGYTAPPYNFSIIVPDGAPSPGYGTWVQPTGALSETSRPWALAAIRNTLATMAPSFLNIGVCFSAFRVGYSSAGETTFGAGVRVCILANEHFSSWAAGVPSSWTKTGIAALTQSTSAAQINWEYTGNAAVLDLSAAIAGQTSGLSQLCPNITDTLTHRLQIDYAYANAQTVSVLTVQISDANRDGTTYYWNATTSAWTTTVKNNVIPPSTTRGRYAIDIVPQMASMTATTMGTTALTVVIAATCDGTATTQTTYTLYRVGLYEKFDLAGELAAQGERALILPLVDAAGWSAISRTASGNTVLEPSNASRTAYKAINAAQGTFPSHPALNRRGYLATGTWTNLIKGSNDFGADWTLISATKTANSVISPLVGEAVATAPTLSATATGALIQQTFGITPVNKSYVGGVWVKKLSTDVNFTDVTIQLGATSVFTRTFTVRQSDGWTLLPFRFSFGGAEVSLMTIALKWGAASNNGQIAVASSYIYDVTGKTDILYPPVCQTAIGATGIVKPTSCVVVTSTPGVDVLSPLTLRPLTSVVRGSFGAIVVPTFGAGSQPDGVIMDLAQSAALNRVVLRVASGALELRRWDSSGNVWFASIALSSSLTPAAGAMTWQRDTDITIRCLWDDVQTQISAGNGNASGTKPGSWAPADTSVASYTIGCDFGSVNQFEGMITDG